MKHKGLIITLIVVVVLAVIAAVIGGAIFLVNLINNAKDPITSAKFESTMEKMDFVIYDAGQQYEEYDYIEEAIIAVEEDEDFQIEFYVLEDDDSAVSFYNNNVKIFKNSASSVKASSTVNFKNGATFKLTSNGKYKMITRVENTVVYVDVDSEYKDDVEEIIKKLGY